MTTLKNISFLLLILFAFSACSDDDTPTPEPAEATTFLVTIENVLPATTYLNAGTTNFLAPGETQEITFHAGKGTYLSFATMFVQSNDLFYAFEPTGLKLYDDNGNPVTGDVTASVALWDAGTEVNEEPGVGPNQAPRQTGPNTGTAENGNVQLVNDGYTYPADEDIIRLTLTHDGGTQFTFLLENISDGASLATPLAPGVWAVHGNEGLLFQDGQPATVGLERIAEDGDNSISTTEITAATGYTSPFAPGVYAIHAEGVQAIFSNGSPDRGAGLEALAEDGNPTTLDGALFGAQGISANGIFNTPEGANAPGPLSPGENYSFSFEAEVGDYLNLATMLVHTNDLFFAFDENGIALFNNETPIEGDLTNQLLLWDAGTEINEYPGAGNNQPARGGSDSGPAENGNVRPVNDGFAYPSTAATIRVNIAVMQ